MPLLEVRGGTSVSDLRIERLGVQITTLHPESELRGADSAFESGIAWSERFANRTVANGDLVAGQNRNSGYETWVQVHELLAAH